MLLAAALLAAPAAAQAPPRISVLGGDRAVAAGETVDGDVVVIGGNLRVLGTVRGDAVVAGGDLFLDPGGQILGDVNVAGGEFHDAGGRIGGEVRTVNGAADGVPARTAVAAQTARTRGTWFTPIAEGISGLVGTLALGLLLGGAGALLVFYALPSLRTTSETVRASPARAAAVGLAATFLVLPAFVALIVLLAVSIVGIPLLVLAVPLYPLAVLGAFGWGLLATAHAVGERTAEQRAELFGRFRNAYGYLWAGLALLVVPLLAANLLTIARLELLSDLVKLAAGAAAWAGATVGLGAVILSRAGRSRSFATHPREAGTEPEDFWETEPLAREPRV